MEKILILGINGFTGIHFQKYIIDHHIDNQFKIIGVDKSIVKRYDFNYIEMDLLNYEDLKKLIVTEKPCYIINLVGLLTSSEFQMLLSINAIITYNLLDICVKNKIEIKKILLIGSAAEYGACVNLPIKEDCIINPITGYGLSKSIQTQFFNYFKNTTDISINLARTFNIVGTHLSPSLSVGSFVHQIKNTHDGDKIIVGNLNTKRDYLAIEDVIDAYWKILLTGKKGQIYNVCQGQSTSMKEILDFLIKQSGKHLIVETNPNFIRKNDIIDIFGDNSLLKKDTQWKPNYNIFTSLKQMLID